MRNELSNEILMMRAWDWSKQLFGPLNIYLIIVMKFYFILRVSNLFSTTCQIHSMWHINSSVCISVIFKSLLHQTDKSRSWYLSINQLIWFGFLADMKISVTQSGRISLPQPLKLSTFISQTKKKKKKKKLYFNGWCRSASNFTSSDESNACYCDITSQNTSLGKSRNNHLRA